MENTGTTYEPELSEPTGTTLNSDEHDFVVTEQYTEDGKIFLGDLYKCKKCLQTHLCCQRVVTATNCTHSMTFNKGCTNEQNS